MDSQAEEPQMESDFIISDLRKQILREEYSLIVKLELYQSDRYQKT